MVRFVLQVVNVLESGFSEASSIYQWICHVELIFGLHVLGIDMANYWRDSN